MPRETPVPVQMMSFGVFIAFALFMILMAVLVVIAWLTSLLMGQVAQMNTLWYR